MDFLAVTNMQTVVLTLRRLVSCLWAGEAQRVRGSFAGVSPKGKDEPTASQGDEDHVCWLAWLLRLVPCSRPHPTSCI